MVNDNDSIEIARLLAQRLEGYDFDESFNQSHWQARLKHESGDGRLIYVSNEDGKRWKISVGWPWHKGHHYTPDDVYPTCTVAKTRTPESIASDIRRKVIPLYHEHYPLQQERLQSWIDHDASEKALRDKIVCEMLGDSIAPHQEDSRQVNVYRHGLNQIRVSGDTVAFDVGYLPKDVAIKLVEFLKENVPERA